MKIKQNLVSKDKYSIKCPYSMTAQFVVVHNTANDASAENEISYMIKNNNQVSFHYAVDDKEIVQGIPTNRNAWHAGDGANGKGNRNGIAVEICYSKSGGDKFAKAEQNAAKFIAQLLKERGWNTSKVKKHKDFSNKNCPHRTLSLGWDRFIKMIQTELDALNKATNTTSTLKYKVGDTVTITGVYTSSSSTAKLNPAKKSGKITKIVKGAKNPYLLENGNIGWTNDSCIIIKTTSTSNKTLKVGSEVKIKKGAIDLNSKRSFASYVYNTIYTVISLSGDTVVFGKRKNVTGKVSKSYVTVV